MKVKMRWFLTNTWSKNRPAVSLGWFGLFWKSCIYWLLVNHLSVFDLFIICVMGDIFEEVVSRHLSMFRSVINLKAVWFGSLWSGQWGVCVSVSNTFISQQFDMVPDTVGASNSVTLKAFTMHMEVRHSLVIAFYYAFNKTVPQN